MASQGPPDFSPEGHPGTARPSLDKLPQLSLTKVGSMRRGNGDGGSSVFGASKTSRTSLTKQPSNVGALVSPKEASPTSARTPINRRRSSLFAVGTTPRAMATHTPRRKKKRPSLHVLGLIEQGNQSGGGASNSNQSPPMTQSFNSMNTNLRSQLNRLDTNMLRTFDSKTGTIEVSHKSTVPKFDRLVKTKYLNYWRDQAAVQEAEEVVKKMEVSERREFAVQSVKRKHEEELKRILAKDVFSPDIARSRVEVSLRMSLEHIVGHLDQDTRPLSIIRMQGAATDTVIYKKAEREAAAEISHFHSKVIPPSTTAVQLMSMAIDSYKERFVPAPPRQVGGNSPIPTKPAGRISRRPSGVFPFGVKQDERTGTSLSFKSQHHHGHAPSSSHHAHHTQGGTGSHPHHHLDGVGTSAVSVSMAHSSSKSPQGFAHLRNQGGTGGGGATDQTMQSSQGSPLVKSTRKRQSIVILDSIQSPENSSRPQRRSSVSSLGGSSTGSAPEYRTVG